MKVIIWMLSVCIGSLLFTTATVGVIEPSLLEKETVFFLLVISVPLLFHGLSEWYYY